MTSNKETVECPHCYDVRLVELVKSGFAGMERSLATQIMQGQFPKGTFLKEVLHKLPSVPPLLNHSKYMEFCDLLQSDLKAFGITPEDVLGALWSIVENDCEEARLLPAITVDSNTGETIVILV